MDNTCSLNEAWPFYTSHSKKQIMSFKIKPGYKADLTILSDDITKIESSKVLNIEIIGTIVDGKFVYQK